MRCLAWWQDTRSRSGPRKLQARHVRILIATDVAGRGLDIPDVAHVVNYDMPLKIGTTRTASAGRAARARTASRFYPSYGFRRGHVLRAARVFEQTDADIPQQNWTSIRQRMRRRAKRARRHPFTEEGECGGHVPRRAKFEQGVSLFLSARVHTRMLPSCVKPRVDVTRCARLPKVVEAVVGYESPSTRRANLPRPRASTSRTCHEAPSPC